mmetsp:Transcript_119856/g.346324  ORF Transcript_119856/g.346324 Transcript_119856/m.346324 type:complete len:243 (+) Transcript_119856:796-1524(+)
MARCIRESDDRLVVEVVRLRGCDDSELHVVVALEDHGGRAVVAQVRMNAHDGPELGEVVAAFVVLAQQAIQDSGDGQRDRRQQAFEEGDERRARRRDLQLIAAGEDRRRDDLAEHEHERHRKNHRQPRRDDPVQEQRQGFVGQGVHQKQCDQQAVMIRDQWQDFARGRLVPLQFQLVLLRWNVFVLGVNNDLHFHGLDGDQAHGKSCSQGRHHNTCEGQERVRVERLCSREVGSAVAALRRR